MSTKQTFKEKIFNLAGGDFNCIEVSDDNFENILSNLLQRYMKEHSDGSYQAIYKLNFEPGIQTYTLPSEICAVTGYYKGYTTNAQAGLPSLQKYLYERDPNMFLSNFADFAIFNAYTQDIDIIAGIEFDFHYSQTTHQFTCTNANQVSSIGFLDTS